MRYLFPFTLKITVLSAKKLADAYCDLMSDGVRQLAPVTSASQTVIHDDASRCFSTNCASRSRPSNFIADMFLFEAQSLAQMVPDLGTF